MPTCSNVRIKSVLVLATAAEEAVVCTIEAMFSEMVSWKSVSDKPVSDKPISDKSISHKSIGNFHASYIDKV